MVREFKTDKRARSDVNLPPRTILLKIKTLRALIYPLHVAQSNSSVMANFNSLNQCTTNYIKHSSGITPPRPRHSTCCPVPLQQC